MIMRCERSEHTLIRGRRLTLARTNTNKLHVGYYIWTKFSPVLKFLDYYFEYGPENW